MKSTKKAYAVFAAGEAWPAGIVTDRSNSKEETRPKKWDNMVFADAWKWSEETALLQDIRDIYMPA